MGHKQLKVVPVITSFQLQRWPMDKEVIPGIDLENHKGPLCRSIGFTNPAPKLDESLNIVKDEAGRPVHEWDGSGWFAAPAFSAYHAVKMLPDMRGHGGWDGQQGDIACSTCPLSKQGLKGEDAKCKPTGMFEVVVFCVGDEMLPKPVYGVIKLSVVNIIAYDDWLKRLDKVHKIQIPAAVIATIEANKAVEKGRTFARVEFDAYSKVDAATQQQVDAAIDETEKILKEAEEAEKAKGEKQLSNGGGATAAASGPSSGEAF